MKALIAGASGLIGSHLLKVLESDPEVKEIHVLTRGAFEVGDKKTIVHRTDFSEDWSKKFHGYQFDVVFCALGTTIRQAKSEQAFRAVDHDLTLEIGKLAKDTSAQQLIVVTALGADPNSKIFYNRVKGETEQDLAKLNLPSLTLVRPSLLLGERSVARNGEMVAEITLKILGPFFFGPLSKYKAIHSLNVARAMRQLSRITFAGVRRIESDELQSLAKIESNRLKPL